MAEVDDSHAIGAYVKGSEAFAPRWEQDAAGLRTALGDHARLGTSYGPSDRMVCDHFSPEGAAQGTFAFIHGGYWLKYDPSFWSHLAAGSLARSGAERPSFLDQAGWPRAAWRCADAVIPGERHFNVIEALSDPASDIIARLTTPP